MDWIEPGIAGVVPPGFDPRVSPVLVTRGAMDMNVSSRPRPVPKTEPEPQPQAQAQPPPARPVLRPRIKVWLQGPNGFGFGSRFVAILEAVDRIGSIKHA